MAAAAGAMAAGSNVVGSALGVLNNMNTNDTNETIASHNNRTAKELAYINWDQNATMQYDSQQFTRNWTPIYNKLQAKLDLDKKLNSAKTFSYGMGEAKAINLEYAQKQFNMNYKNIQTVANKTGIPISGLFKVGGSPGTQVLGGYATRNVSSNYTTNKFLGTPDQSLYGYGDLATAIKNNTRDRVVVVPNRNTL